MADYDLNRMDWRAFEQMVVSLGRAELSSGMRVFGDGPDGGREADLDGRIQWSKTVVDGDSRDVWDGYTVIQSKFCKKPGARPITRATWLQREIKHEIENWISSAKKRSRDRFPDYLIFVTNLELSSVARSGGIDSIHRLVRELLEPGSDAAKAGLQIRDFRIWHQDQIKSLLDSHQTIRWAYPGLLTPGDVIAGWPGETVNFGSLDLGDSLREQVLRTLSTDRKVRLQESGAPSGSVLIDDVAIDLPARAGSEPKTLPILRYLIGLGDAVLRQKLPDRVAQPHVVVVGGPGQGKSTLGQMLAQSYRIAMLEGADLAPDPADSFEGWTRALARLGTPPPGNRRWPVRIDLAKLAEELSSGQDVSLLRWLARQVSTKSTADVSPAQLKTFLRAWPWALILDGFDEVPSLDARQRVLRCVNDFILVADDLDADLFVMVTTRPLGYEEEFAQSTFRRLDLQRLDADAALSFAERMVELRLSDDNEARDLVLGRVRDAANDPTTAALMGTPLQLTIMSLIVEKFPHLPPDRYSLFHLYYGTIADREAAKEIAAGRFITENRPAVDRLHELAGLHLQAKSESSEAADSVLTPGELEALANALYQKKGFEPGESTEKASALVQAATHRLVLLVPQDDGVGFEVRTLQELMAARALVDADDDGVIERLRTISRSPHWGNTWLLAAGALLVKSDRFAPLLVGLLRELSDPSDIMLRISPIGGGLAAAMLEDGLALRLPSLERDLLGLTLRAAEDPASANRSSCVAALRTMLNTKHRSTILQRLRDTGSGAGSRAARAITIYDLLDLAPTRGSIGPLRVSIGMLGLTSTEMDAIKIWRAAREGKSLNLKSTRGPRVGLDDHLTDQWADAALSTDEVDAFRDALAGIGGSKVRLPPDGDSPSTVAALVAADGTSIHASLKRPEIAAALHLVMDQLPERDWSTVLVLSQVIGQAVGREPVGSHVLHLAAQRPTD